MLLVAVTGWGQEEDKRRAVDAGFDHHLTKPVQDAGTGTVVLDILTSAESYTHIITGYYEAYLNRAPEPAGLALWLGELEDGTGTAASVADSILGSGEYADTH
jgi:CheY-like chemotaxis protein